MKKIVVWVLLLIMLINMSGCRTYIPKDQPVVETAQPFPDFALGKETDARLKYVLNCNLKYLLNTWWNAPKKEALLNSSNMPSGHVAAKEHSMAGKIRRLLSDVYHGRYLNTIERMQIKKSQKSFSSWRDEEYLDILINSELEKTENSIRPLSHVCDVVAISLIGDYYDETIVGVSKEDARKMLILLASSAAREYMQGKWGNTWQSALWAENIGFAAWTVWDDISENDRNEIAYMILSEADYVLNREIPYYRNAAGNELTPGDTKGEEIAWDSKILALSLCMFPEHKDAKQWEEKLEQMLIAATATPQDTFNTETIDSVVPADFLAGSNINDDGTVVNHNRYHIDYMTTIIEEMTETMILFKLAGRECIESPLHNVDLIYGALVNVDLGRYDESKVGSHFYQRDADGNVSRFTDMPGKNDWGGYWYGSDYLADTYADIFELDKEIDPLYKAENWADVHLDALVEMVSRNEEGNFFIEGENRFVSGEMFQMHNIARACLLQKLFAADVSDVSK